MTPTLTWRELRAAYPDHDVSTLQRLGIDQSGSRIRKLAAGIDRGFASLSLNKDRPAGAEPAHGVVDTPGDRDQFGGNSGIQIRPAKLCSPLETTVLVQHDARAN